MIRVIPILLAVLYGFAMYRFSAWRTAKELDAKSSELTDPNMSEMRKRLAQALNLPRIKVNIYEIAPVNALAAPDGRIFITRGFYNRFKSGDVSAEELASVIAHELGHVALGHSRRRMIDFSGQNAIRTVIMMVVGRFVPFIGPMIANFFVRVLASKLSRVDEYEADAYAAALLTKAGIGIEPQISLFEKLEALTQTNHGTAPAWLMSHPKSEERIAALRRLQAKWEN